MDSNHDKQNQNLLCYRYTTGQTVFRVNRERRAKAAGRCPREAKELLFRTPRLPIRLPPNLSTITPIWGQIILERGRWLSRTRSAPPIFAILGSILIWLHALAAAHVADFMQLDPCVAVMMRHARASFAACNAAGAMTDPAALFF
jgi:hypothetical protein